MMQWSIVLFSSAALIYSIYCSFYSRSHSTIVGTLAIVLSYPLVIMLPHLLFFFYELITKRQLDFTILSLDLRILWIWVCLLYGLGLLLMQFTKGR